jgi:hypothetical protein
VENGRQSLLSNARILSRATQPLGSETAIGIRATGTSRETGSMGEIEVPADRDWGAHRQCSLVDFSIDDDRRRG